MADASPTEDRLAAVHRAVAGVAGEVALALARRSVTLRALRRWAEVLRRAAEELARD